MKVLVADDIPMIRKLVQYHLTQIGFETSNASDGAEALMLASNFRYDLILLDIMMPEMDGLEVLQRLRTDSINKDTPVIMMTAYGDTTTVKKAVEYGATDFIVKPIEQLTFRKKVMEILKMRSAESAG